jgi:hypothetical protein
MPAAPAANSGAAVPLPSVASFDTSSWRFLRFCFPSSTSAAAFSRCRFPTGFPMIKDPYVHVIVSVQTQGKDLLIFKTIYGQLTH